MFFSSLEQSAKQAAVPASVIISAEQEIQYEQKDQDPPSASCVAAAILLRAAAAVVFRFTAVAAVISHITHKETSLFQHSF